MSSAPSASTSSPTSTAQPPTQLSAPPPTSPSTPAATPPSAAGASDWPVLPHRPLQKLADGLWQVEGDLPNMSLGRRMVVIQRGDGLVVHNPIACDPATMAELEALGPVTAIVVPNGYHRIDCARFASRYPAAHVYAPPASLPRVRQRVDRAQDLARLPTSLELTAHIWRGAPREGVLLHRAPDGSATAICNDLLFNLPARLPGFGGWLAKMMGSLGGPKLTPIGRLMLVDDKRALAAHLRELAQTPGLERAIPGHGAVISTGAADVFTRLAARLSHISDAVARD